MFRKQRPAEGVLILTVSAAFQAQLDRLTAGVKKLADQIASLEAAMTSADAEDTSALSSALDAAGVAPAAEPATVQQ